MRVVKTIQACGRDVTVKELTVGEIRAWLAGVTERAAGGDVVDVALLDEDGATLGDIKNMSDLTVAEIDDLTPSELAAVLASIKEVNRSFFTMRAKLERLGEAALTTQRVPEPSAD